MPNGDKLSVKEFSSKIKAKHPQYKDMDDMELTKKILDKYPQYQGKVELKKKDTGLSPQSDQPGDGSTLPSVEETLAGPIEDNREEYLANLTPEQRANELSKIQEQVVKDPSEKERNPFVTFGKRAWQTLGYDVPATGASSISAIIDNFETFVRSPEINPKVFESLNSDKHLSEKAKRESKQILEGLDKMKKGVQSGEVSEEEYHEFTQNAKDRLAFLEGFSDLAPKGGLAEETKKELTTWAAKRMEKGQKLSEDLITSLDQINDPIDALNWATGALGQAAGQIPLSVATLGTSSISQEIGSIYLEGIREKAKEEGISMEEVIDRGLDDGASSTAFGLVAGAMDFMGATNVISSFTKKQLTNALRKRALGAIDAGAVESLTETGQTILEQIGANVGAGKENIWQLDPKEIREAAAQGAIGGLGLGGAGQITRTTDVPIKKQQKDAKRISRQTQEISQQERAEGRTQEGLRVRDTEKDRINVQQAQQKEKVLADKVKSIGIEDARVKTNTRGATRIEVPKELDNKTIEEIQKVARDEGAQSIAIVQDVSTDTSINDYDVYDDGSVSTPSLGMNLNTKLSDDQVQQIEQIFDEQGISDYKIDAENGIIETDFIDEALIGKDVDQNTINEKIDEYEEKYSESVPKIYEIAGEQAQPHLFAKSKKTRFQSRAAAREGEQDRGTFTEITELPETERAPKQQKAQKLPSFEEATAEGVARGTVKSEQKLTTTKQAQPKPKEAQIKPPEPRSTKKATVTPKPQDKPSEVKKTPQKEKPVEQKREEKIVSEVLKQKKAKTKETTGKKVKYTSLAGQPERGTIIGETQEGKIKIRDIWGNIENIDPANVQQETTPPLQAAETARKQVREKAEVSDKVNSVVAKVQQAFPKISVVTDPDMVPENVRDLPGAFVKGRVYINPEHATKDTPIHEFAHLWTGIAKQVNPYVLKRVTEDVKQTEHYKKLKNDPNYKDLTEDQIVEEAFVRTVSDKGVKRLSKTKIGKAFDQILDIIKRGLKKIGIDPGTNLTSLTLDKLSSRVAKELLAGRPLTQTSSVDINAILNKKSSDSKLAVSNSILNDSGNRFFRDVIRKHVNSQLRTSRGMTLKLRDDVEGLGNKISAVSQVMKIKMRHLKDLIKEYSKNNGDQKAEQLVKDLGDVFSGNKHISDLPDNLKAVMEDIMRHKRYFIDKLKNNLILKGDVIGAFNSELELYLTENFNRKESLDSVENQLLDKHKKEARELLSVDETQLENEYKKLQKRNNEVNKNILRTKLKELQGQKKLIETIRKDADAKTSKLIKDYNEAVSRLQQAQKMQGKETIPKAPKDKSKSKLVKEVNKQSKEISELLKQPENLTTNQLNILEQIESINEAINELMQGAPERITRNATGKFLEQIQNKEIKQIKAHQDLGLVDFVQYKHKDGKFNITFNHKDGHQHNVKDVSREDMVSMLGESATRNMEFQNTGIHKLTTPRILLNNPLYERIKKNDDKYVHRSYMLHDVKDFAENIKKYVGEDIYNKAINFIRDRYEDHRVAAIRKETTQEGKVQYVFKNVYGVESQPFTAKNIEQHLRDIGVKEKDISSFRNVESGVDFALTSPTSYWNETGIDNFTLPSYRIDEILSNILDTNNFDNTFGNDNIGNKVDHKIFKKRKDIAKEIRDLMGEYTNPQITMEKTLIKGSIKAESDRFYMEFIQKGINEGVVSETKTKFHTQKISSEKLGVPESKEYYTTPELYDFMFATLRGPGNFEKAWMAINGMVKMNFTVLRGASQTRNFWGAGENLWAATGSIESFKRINEAFKIVSQDFSGNEGVATYLSTPVFMMKLFNGKKFGNKGDVEMQKLYQELAEEGILHSNVEGAAARELAEIMQSSNNMNDLMSKLKNVANKPIQAASKVYQLSDSVFKAAQYFHEKDLYKKAGYTEQEARSIASNISKNLQPHYQRAPRIFKALSRNPLGGSFVMFKAEMFRTRFNILKQGIKEVQSGNKVLKRAGWQRLGGLASQSLTSQAIRLTAMALLGITDDEDEAVRWMMAEYERNNALIYLDKDLRKPQYIDLTFIDPSSAYTNAAIALTSDRENNLLEAGKELVGDFFTSEIFTQNMFQIISNQDDYGNPIVYETDDLDVKMEKWSSHASKALTPGEVKDMQKILESMIDPDRRGYKLSTRDEVMNRVLGIKMKERDIVVNYRRKSYDLKNRFYESRKIFNNEEKTRENYETAKRKIEETFEEMKKGYNYIQKVGYSPEEVRRIIFDSDLMPEYMYYAVKRGYMVDSDYGIDESEIKDK